MKKHFFFASLLMSLCGTAQAQSHLETYSVYDVNRQDGTSVADATLVVNRAIEAIQDDPQVIDASVLNAILQSIDQRLQKLDALETRLAEIEAKLGIEAPGDDPYNAHEYVDLGLSVKWATCNVGATTPEDYGDYFAWGDTEPYYSEGHSQDSPCSDWKAGKTGYDWANYKWCNGSAQTLTKYCVDAHYGAVDNKTVLDSEDDAASVNWGELWRVPTHHELIELKNNCTWTWETMNGVNGYKVTGTNGNWIFLPTAGQRGGSNLHNQGSKGNYWASTTYHLYDPRLVYNLTFDSSNIFSANGTNRYFGFCVRPVTE